MPLKDMLSDVIAGVEGALSVMVMASDGVAVAEVTADGAAFDLQLISVEYATVLKEIRRTVEVIHAGELEEVCVTTDRLRAIMRALNDELFAVLILSREGNIGMGRHRLHLKSFELARELT
ncbi:roadblock/LC7 domain-containing protein [Geobacter sp. SVR]|uniref:roadblock/LC7 domain-containing protein n=1 Tax=Geobacter sp. SVR TaxID=2495594 RepID=UPI00143EFA24|nr:roadblock/LC7 domain-containing protein [Geobacter sp. SVR]BCS54280.1 GTPase [Geobacter sp. SVR]GCF85861.1 GTPase [Geobacter sp. SVR]